MGDTMILNEHEVKTCLIYALTPLLKKYEVIIKEAQLLIDHQIIIKAQVNYQERLFDLNVSFSIGYKNHQLCFEKITGKVEYLFLSLNIMSVLQQLIHDESVTFSKNNLYYQYELPIQELIVSKHQLQIKLDKM